jgi:hypothetical protein
VTKRSASDAKPATGQPCPNGCGGHLIVYTSRRRQSIMVRYYQCCDCLAKPETRKAVVRAGHRRSVCQRAGKSRTPPEVAASAV